MPRSCPIVTTPVPPTPVTMMPYAPCAGNDGSAGCGKLGTLPAALGLPFLSCPPSTVTKLGQKPFRHE